MPRVAALPAVGLLAALVGTACGGGGPHLARTDAAPLLELTRKIAHEGPCAQARDIRALDARFVALVNGHRVPAALQEPLSSGVNALVAQTPPCLPPLPASDAAPAPGKHEPHDNGKHGHEEKD